MRADRLLATLLILQARTRLTAAELAVELEVSVATARRDLEALSAAGVPVYPQPGRGGGWSLLGGARTDLSGLTSAEAQALFLLLGPAAAMAPDAKSALRKLLQALPAPFRADAAAAAGTVLVDAVRWGEQAREQSDLVEVLQAAVIARRTVRMTYRKQNGDQAERLVDPLGLVDKDEVWYLLGATDRGERTFRVDRVLQAEVTDRIARRPAGFELSAAWQRVVDEVEHRQSAVVATVLVQQRHLAVLQSQFGRHAELLGRIDDGRCRVAVRAPAAVMIAQHLAGWGGLVEVVDSPSVAAQLARLGGELVARYDRGPVSSP